MSARILFGVSWVCLGWCFALAQVPGLPPIRPDQARLALSLAGVEQPVLGLAHIGDYGPVVNVTERGLVQWWTWPQLIGVQISQTNAAWQLPAGVVYTALSPCPLGRVALGTSDGKIYIYSIGMTDPPLVLPGHAGSVRALARVGEAYLVSGGDDGVVIVWDAVSGKIRAKWSAHSDWLSAIAGNEKIKALATAGYDSAIRLWDLENGQKVRELSISPAGSKPSSDLVTVLPLCCSLVFSPDGKWLASGYLDGIIRLYDVSNGALIRSMVGHGSQVSALLAHASGQVLISGSRDRTIRLWNVASGQPIRVLEGHQSWVQGLVLLDRGTRLVSVSVDGTLKVWDLRPAK